MLRLSKLQQVGNPVGDGAMQTVLDLTANAIQELRTLSTGLVLPEIGDLTSAKAIKLAVDRHMDLTGSTVNLELGSLPQKLPTALTICIYRVVQEALINSFKHAGGVAQKVRANQAGGRISIRIADGGGGLKKMPNEAESSRRLGILGIRNRVQALGGIVDIRSSSSGLEVCVELPFDANPRPVGETARETIDI